MTRRDRTFLISIEYASDMGTNRMSKGAGGVGPMRGLNPARPGREKWSFTTMTVRDGQGDAQGQLWRGTGKKAV